MIVQRVEARGRENMLARYLTKGVLGLVLMAPFLSMGQSMAQDAETE